jgi:ParB/RepB/Spo0J family partition protein
MNTPNQNSLGDILDLAVGLIDPDPKNRKDHDKEALLSLADSIKAEGLLQPIVVRLHPAKSGRYMIVAGERRWLAHQLNKAATVQARLVKAGTAEAAAVRKRAVENFQREDLTPIQEAQQFRELIEDHKMSQPDVAKLAGKKNPSYVSNSLRLLSLPPVVQGQIQTGELTRAHGVALAKWAPWPKACALIANFCIKEDIPSKRIEAYVPCADQLIEAGFAVDLEYWYEKASLPKGLKELPSIFDANNEWDDESVLCLDVKQGQLIVADERAARDKASKSSTKGGVSSSGEVSTGMTPAELRARNAKIAENKQNRAESVLGRTAVLEHLKAMRDIDPSALAVVASWAFEAHWKIASGPRVKAVAEALGIKLAGKLATDEPEKLSKLKPIDLLRLVAGCICDRECEEGEKYTNPISPEVEVVLGEKKTAAVKKAAADQLAAAEAARAAKKGGKK